jgi:hypothetical protein
MTGGKVISLEIDERKMGDRGSKSDSVCKRATSRRFFSSDMLAVRCTLVTGKPALKRKLYTPARNSSPGGGEGRSLSLLFLSPALILDHRSVGY